MRTSFIQILTQTQHPISSFMNEKHMKCEMEDGNRICFMVANFNLFKLFKWKEKEQQAQVFWADLFSVLTTNLVARTSVYN